MSKKQGTTVVVQDLFGNMPVRVKRRQMLRDSAREIEKRWRELRLLVFALVLPWPSLIDIRLRDVNDGAYAYFVSGKSFHKDKAKSFQSLDSFSIPSFDLERTRHLIAQLIQVSPGTKGTLVPASASASGISIKGVISTEPAPTKKQPIPVYWDTSMS